MPSRTMNGKALEFAFLDSLERHLSGVASVRVITSPALTTAQNFYLSQTIEVQRDMSLAADAGIQNIINMEPRLSHGTGILDLSIQSDAQGRAGDVRDVIAVRSSDGWEVGISCKNNHYAVKHSRLSATIDVGDSWFGYHSTAAYFSDVVPIFNHLSTLGARGELWNRLPNKAADYYVPVLEAFMAEIRRLDAAHPGQIPGRMLMYLLGRNDFYKTIANTRRRVTEIQGFNLYGTLNQSVPGHRPLVSMRRAHLPTTFHSIDFKPGSQTTILFVCDYGWTISARIHNASTIVEGSLKFDVKLTGVPPAMYNQTIGW